MAAFNFPNSPSTNDLHTENNVTWKWDGTMWNRVSDVGTTLTQLNVTGVSTFAGNVHVGGVLTYEDVKNVDSVGIITARTGLSVTAGDVVIPDTIVHAGDTNTKIRFPAADTFSVETAGLQNFKVNGTRVALTSPSGTNTTLRLQHQGNSGYGDIILDRQVNAFIIDNDPSNASNNQSYFSVKNKGTTNLHIKYDGKIGINTSSPARLIHAYESTNNNLLFLESGDTNVDIIQADTGGSTRIRNSQGSLVFYVNGDANSSSAANAVTGLTIDGDKDVHVYDDLFIPDKIIHEGDTNTAIRFPSADTITAETGGSERLRITSGGKTLIHGGGATGANDTATVLDNGNTLNIHGTSSSDGISVVRYSANYGAYGINIGKSRNNTFGTNTLVQDGNELGHISFYGADGTDFEMAAQITGLVDGDPATGGDGTDMPGALSFRTTPEGSDGVTERFRISANGRVAVGNATNNANTNALFKAVADDGEAADLYVGHFINLEATAGQSYGVNIQAGSNSTDHGFRVRNRANNTTQFLVRGDGQALFDRGAPASANKTIARFQAESSRKLDIVWHDSGSLMGFDTPGNHAYIFKANGSEKVRFQTSYGGVLVNSCQRWQWGGSAACNTTWSVQFTPLTGGGGGNIYHIKAYFSHHSLSYGAYLEGVYGAYAGHTGLQIDNDENSSNSSAGGSWDVTRASSGSNPPVVITHTAGTYNGSGHWFVWVIAGHQ